MSIWLKDIKDQNVFWRVTGSWNYAQPKNDKRLFWQQKGWNLKAKQIRWITHFLDNKLSLSQNYVLFSAGPGFHAFPNSWFIFSMSGIFGPERMDRRMKILIGFLFKNVYLCGSGLEALNFLFIWFLKRRLILRGFHSQTNVWSHNHRLYLAIFENGTQLKISSDIKPLLKRPFELGLINSTPLTSGWNVEKRDI